GMPPHISQKPSTTSSLSYVSSRYVVPSISSSCWNYTIGEHIFNSHRCVTVNSTCGIMELASYALIYYDYLKPSLLWGYELFSMYESPLGPEQLLDRTIFENYDFSPPNQHLFNLPDDCT